MAELIDQVDNGDGTITNYYDDGSSDLSGTKTSTSTDSGGGGFTGGIKSGGIVDPDTGNITYLQDDGSSITVDANGNPVSATNTEGKVVTTLDDKGNVVVTAAGKENPSFWGSASNLFTKAVDKVTNNNGLRNLFTTTANGVTTVNPAAAGIGAIIGMLNRRTGEEGTRGLKEGIAAKTGNMQQIVSPVGAATGQGQNYFTPMDYAGGAPTREVTTTGGGIAGLNPGTAKPANYVNPNAQRVTSASGNTGIQTLASSDVINNLLQDYNQIKTQPVKQEPTEQTAKEMGTWFPNSDYFNKTQPVKQEPTEQTAKEMGTWFPNSDYFNNPQPTQEPVKAAAGGMMNGGISTLGSYTHAAGGRMLKGPGDGMSDDIPASIGGKQPARLATDEFVVPADVVSHLGNGSSDAGAKVLYDMMNRVRKARTGNSKQGKKIKPQKFMPH
jgi:hypothetical protein